jgi:hypothetical protein
MFSGFMKGFTGKMSENIEAAEKAKLEQQRQAADNLKEQNMATLTGQLEAQTLEKEQTFKADESALERASKEKIAGMKSTAKEEENIITADKAADLAVETGLTEPEEITRFTDMLTGKTMAEVEATTEAEPEGWFAKKWRQGKAFIGLGGEEAPTAPTVRDEDKTQPTFATEAPRLAGNEAKTAEEVAPGLIRDESIMDLQPQKEAPPRALDILRGNPSPQNIKFFEQTFGYIPEEYK